MFALIFSFTGKDIMSKSQNHSHDVICPKVVIDTDPGIDDAMAIMMALTAHNKGEIDVLAITLVNGNSDIKHSEVNILRILETFSLEDKVITQVVVYTNTLLTHYEIMLNHANFA